MFDKFPEITRRESSTIYVIPNSGCSGCITNAETYAMENQDDSSVYLFTRISSMKLFKSRFEKEFLGRKDVIIDSNNLFDFPKETPH